jgi:hypothetical protein
MPQLSRPTKSTETYLNGFLNQMGLLLDSDTKFSPNHGKVTRGVVKLITPKFTQTISKVTPLIPTYSSTISRRGSIQTKHGIYLDTVLNNMNQYPTQHNDTTIKKQLIRCVSTNRLEELYELCNRNHMVLYNYWVLDNYPPPTMKDLYSYFCGPEILHEIEQKILVTRNVVGSYDNNTFKLNISGKSEKDVTGSLADSLIVRLCCMIGLATTASDEIFNVSVWLTGGKKRLQYKINPNNRFLGIRNVNSGCTIRDHDTPIIGRICIWRREECEKVLIHELIHAIGLDFYKYPETIDDQVFKQYNLVDSGTVNLFESYTETWAVVFSSILTSIIDGDGSWQQIKNILRQETRFSLFQLAKIIDYFGYSTYSNCNFFCESGFLPDSTRKFNQGSSVMSYYIIKTALLYKLDDFLDLCLTCNSKSTPWCFQNNIVEFWEFIQNTLASPDFIEIVEHCLVQVKQYKKHHRSNFDHIFGLVTLRMTATR